MNRTTEDARPDARTRETVVFFEPETGGHQWYFVRYLLSALLQQDWGFAAEFVLHPDLAQRVLSDIARTRPTTAVHVTGLTSAELAATTSHPLWLRAFRKWRLVKRYLRRTGANHWHFMNIDEMQVPMALRYRLPQDVTVSGILFRPSVHYDGAMARPRYGERVRDLRKRVAYRRMFDHPNLATLYSLDPLFADHARAAFKSGAKVQYLPDPIPTTEVIDPTADPHVVVGDVPAGRVRFLMFGALQARKGILKALEALHQLPGEAAGRIAVLFVGRLEEGLRHRAMQSFQRLTVAQPSLWVRLVDGFVEDRDLLGLLNWCNFVLAPYQRFVGSSGILIWAAGARRAVVTQDYGLMGVLTARYGLGVTVDSTDPRKLATVLARLARDPSQASLSRSGCDAFIRGRTPGEFAKIVLEGIRSARATRTGAPRDAR